MKHNQLLRSVVLLFGAYVFAFLVGEAVHEFGHYLADTAWGIDVRIVLDPFGASRIVAISPFPTEPLGIPALAGPLLNIALGLTISLVLWRFSRPVLLPLILWGPSALIQEGFNLSMGLMSPGSDADVIVSWGIPGAIVLIIGLGLLVSGLVTLCSLFPLMGIKPSDGFLKKWGILTGGMVTLLVIRGVHALILSPSAISENIIPLAAGAVLTAVIAGLQGVLLPLLDRVSPGAAFRIAWRDAVVALSVGGIVFGLQWLF